MGLLTDLNIAVSYRSDMGNIVDLFYVPCLERAIIYRRAVGYFTSGGLAAAAKGLASFAGGKGKMFLVASPYLDEDDLEAISKGYRARHDVVTRALVRSFDGEVDGIVRDRLACLAWLIATERLEIKIAMPRAATARRGIYHEKMGIFEDAAANKVAFSGSPNETLGGLVDNFESIDVYWSWHDPQGRVTVKEQNFDALWDDKTATLEILPFPDAARERLLQFRPTLPPVHDPESSHRSLISPSAGRPRSSFGIPPSVNLRDYQTAAIQAWFDNGSRGLLEMATGTGKTITALCAALRLFNECKNLGVLVLAPFQHLVDQWDDIARTFGLLPIKCYEASKSWREILSDQLTDLNIGARPVLWAIATYATASQSGFLDIIQRIRKPLLLIADEAHHAGAPIFSRSLAPSAKFRLGLSATPSRWFDPSGTQLLEAYFGKTVFSFPLEEAIAKGVLCHYEYYPHLSPLDTVELQRYADITTQIARIWSQAEHDDRARSKLEFLLRERTNILNCAQSKLDQLPALIGDPSRITYTLFYCAPGQLDAVVSLLAEALHIRIRRFTQEETAPERQRLLAEFEDASLQALAAIRCLDEGVDLPATKTAFILASSSNPGEFIQRRGRILRPHPNKRRAVIHDMLAIPPPGATHTDARDIESTLLRRELRRFKEFASAADNEYSATAEILQIATQFHVLDF